MGSVQRLDTKAAFDMFVAEHPVVVVEFWAEWCGPCKKLGPVIEEIAAASPDLPFAKANIDDLQELAAGLSIMSVPATLVIRGGIVVKNISGAAPRGKFEADIRSAL